MIYQRKRKCVGKSFLIPMELALLVLLVLLQLVTLPRFECDKHASLASCHSKRKIQQQHIFACFGKSRLSTGAGGSAPCGNYSGRSCFATPSSSFSSPWSTGSLSICHIQFLHWYLYCIYRTHNSYIWHTDDLMKPLNRERKFRPEIEMRKLDKLRDICFGRFTLTSHQQMEFERLIRFCRNQSTGEKHFTLD